MNEEQLQAAQQAMIDWLKHPQELGKEPAKIECTEEFDLHGLHYYIFRYKKSVFSRWMLGVCGGYQEDDLNHCGHVFSEMEPYEEVIARDRCIAMVERIRAYWKAQAARSDETGSELVEDDNEQAPMQESHFQQQEEEKSEYEETVSADQKVFLGFTLLSEAKWDREQLVNDLKKDWGLSVKREESDRVDLLCFSGTSKIFISLMPMPIPSQEAELNAENNYMWKGAVEAAREHKAHLTVAVLDQESDPKISGQLFVKVMACCCKQRNALGIYTGSTVVAPDFYADLAQTIKEDQLPVLNWIWFQLYRSEKGLCCYTDGMRQFGKEEMEILDADGKPTQVRDLLVHFASYVLENDVELHSGDTIGFSKDDRHAITISDGVGQTGSTLKISYQAV